VIEELDRRDFDEAMPVLRVKPGRLGVDNEFADHTLNESNPRLLVHAKAPQHGS
jgi:hypothetical protein